MGRAIVRKPEVFLFDEPLSNLDAKLRGPDAHRDQEAARARALDRHLRHPRPGRGDDARRPHRHHARRPHRTGRYAGRGVPPAGDALRRRLHRLADDEPRRREIDDGRIVFADGDWLPVPDRFRNVALANRHVVFGLRPDDVYPTGHGLPSAAGSQVVERELPVSVTEPLGNETLVFVPFGGRDWIARMLNPVPLAPGERIGVSFDLAKAHLFDRRRAVDCGDGRLTWRGSSGSNCGWSTSRPRSSAPTRSRASSRRRRRSSRSPTPTARSAPATATRSAPAARR